MDKCAGRWHPVLGVQLLLRRGKTKQELTDEMALPNPNENRTLMEYFAPTVTTSPSCIIRSEVAANNFELKPSFIQMMPSFYGLSTEDPNLHTNEFLEICDTLKIHHVPSEAIRLRMFPFSLKDKAKNWLHSLPPNLITTWKDLANKFLQKFSLLPRLQS